VRRVMFALLLLITCIVTLGSVHADGNSVGVATVSAVTVQTEGIIWIGAGLMLGFILALSVYNTRRPQNLR